MTIQSQYDLRELSELGKLVAATLQVMAGAARPGLTTAQLDAVGACQLRQAGARSAPRQEYGFPGWTCLSVNDAIVHGVPGAYRLRPGDVLKIDVTAERDGYVVDAAMTVALPPQRPVALRMMDCAQRARERGIGQARAGKRINAIGAVIDATVSDAGFSVFRELCGHGVGARIHEEPNVPNFADPSATQRLWPGLVLAIEPLIASRPARVYEDRDGWTVRTHNRALAVHFEHTVVVREAGPALVLTQTL